MRISSRQYAAMVAVAVGVAGPGCSPSGPSNLSPIAHEDADRYAEAAKYTNERASQLQEAEKKAMSRLRRPRASRGGGQVTPPAVSGGGPSS